MQLSPPGSVRQVSLCVVTLREMIAKKLFKLAVYVFATIGFVLVAGYIAIKYGFTNTRGVIDTQRDFFSELMKQGVPSRPTWSSTREWQVFKEAVSKEKDPILNAAKAADVDARIIVGLLVAEQLRLFYSERELFKQVFAPLKILGNQSQFSWGVMGIKQDTAIAIENHLKNSVSPFYPGKKYEHLLDFATANPDNERFERLTDEKNHYYSYLYSALHIKQLEEQWERAGFPIKNRPEILGTLFNIGFANSKPNPNPQPGGAEIEIGNEKYSFGSLVASFYYSTEILSEFPRQ
jgi:hypothetical protein